MRLRSSGLAPAVTPTTTGPAYTAGLFEHAVMPRDPLRPEKRTEVVKTCWSEREFFVLSREANRQGRSLPELIGFIVRSWAWGTLRDEPHDFQPSRWPSMDHVGHLVDDEQAGGR